MRAPTQNLAPARHVVNPESVGRLKSAICNFAVLTAQRPDRLSRAPYLRRLHQLAAGSPRGMNFAHLWIRTIRLASEFSPVGSSARGREREAWLELNAAAVEVVEWIRLEIRS